MKSLPLLYSIIFVLITPSSQASDELPDIYINRVLERCDASFTKTCNFDYTFGYNKGYPSVPGVYLEKPSKGELNFYTTINCDPYPDSTFTIGHYIGANGRQAIVLIEEVRGFNWDTTQYVGRWDPNYVGRVMKGGPMTDVYHLQDCRIGPPAHFEGGGP
jgi:hypothetical protein